MKLFAISRISELLLNEVLETAAHERIVLCTPHLVDTFTTIGINPLVVDNRNFSPEERDGAFSALAMPGKFSGVRFHETSLPAWKVLGIDRLRFWYYPFDDAKRIADLIEYDELVISLDLHSSWIWLLVRPEKKTTAVKTTQVLTRECLDFLKSYPIHTLVVSYDEEKQFLLKQKIKAKKIVSRGGSPPKRPRDADLREKTIGLYYDSRYDWKALLFFMTTDLGGNKLVVGLPNNREWQKFLTTFPFIHKNPQIELNDMIGLTTCETVMLPVYDEAVIRQLPENVTIRYYDYHDLDGSSQLKDVFK